MMSTAPATPPSTRSAVALFLTITWLTSSDGNSEKLTLRPTSPTWSSTNQSPDATAWPLMSVCVRLGLVPRMLTRSFSSNPPSPPEAELMVTPGTRETASAMFLSGSLPMSSAEITSTTLSALRLVSMERSRDARMPVTVMVSLVSAFFAGGVVAACCACAWNAIPESASATAEAMGVGLNCIFMPPLCSRRDLMKDANTLPL